MFRMKNLFHAVGTISPLVILVSSHWTTQRVAREHMLSVSTSWLSPVFVNHPQQIFYALGNERPHALREIERALWGVIMRIACGSSAEKELKMFMVEYKDIAERWRLQGVTDLDLSFFLNGAKPFLLHSNLLNMFQRPCTCSCLIFK